MTIKPVVRIMLKTIWTTFSLRIEFLACEIAHHFPIAITAKDVFEPSFADRTDMIFCVLRIKLLAAGEPINPLPLIWIMNGGP